MKHKIPCGVWVALVQTVAYATLGVLMVLMPMLVPSDRALWTYRLCDWAVLPALGAVAAYFATRKGLHYMISWIGPPILMTAAYWTMSGMPPMNAASVMLCALVSIIGSAAGHEMNKRK